MNGHFVLNTLRVLITSAVVATIATLWQLMREEAVLEERVTLELMHGEKRDAAIDRRLERIEQYLNELRR